MNPLALSAVVGYYVAKSAVRKGVQKGLEASRPRDLLTDMIQKLPPKPLSRRPRKLTLGQILFMAFIAFIYMLGLCR